MRYVKHLGIVINRRAVGDSDRFLTIFTRESGKISVYAHSVRSVKSKRAGAVELFSCIAFEASEKGGHRTLTHVELQDSHRDSKKDLKNISRLFQLGELVDAFLPEDDPHPEIYALLETALTHLSHFDTPEYLRRFKLRLLKELGFGAPPADLDDYIESLLDRPLKTRNFIS